MYVCIEVALCGLPMERGIQMGLGRGPSKVGPLSQPHGYHQSLWTGKDDLIPHVGVVSHCASFQLGITNHMPFCIYKNEL